MNREQILGLIRHILTAAGSALVVKGAIDAGDLAIAAGAITSLIGVAWSYFAPEKKAAC